MFNGLKKLVVISFCISFSHIATAKLLFHRNGITFLYGTTFRVPMGNSSLDPKRFIITLDQLSVFDEGDIFYFLDIIHSTDRGNLNNLYGELFPRFSLYSLTNQEKPKGFIKDVLLASTLEYGGAANGTNQLNYLVGLGANIAIPGFKFFSLNGFRRFNQRIQDSWQASPVWSIPFSIQKHKFIFDGWADYVFPNRFAPHNLHTQMQLKWDAGFDIFSTPNKLFLGTEYRYWKNKFGITGIRESVFQALIKYRFA